MKYFVLVLLLIGFVSAADIDFDCPDEIFVDEEFECSLEIFDGNGEYDVKIDLDGERNSVLELWNNGEWKSGYYYLQEFIEEGDERNIRMRISEEGDWEGELKLRKGDAREFFDIEIDVEENKDVIEEEFEGEVVNVVEEVIVLAEEDGVLSLNSFEKVDELVYVSKDAKVVSWLPYAFSLFLVFIIVILLWERF